MAATARRRVAKPSRSDGDGPGETVFLVAEEFAIGPSGSDGDGPGEMEFFVKEEFVIEFGRTTATGHGADGAEGNKLVACFLGLICPKSPFSSSRESKDDARDGLRGTSRCGSTGQNRLSRSIERKDEFWISSACFATLNENHYKIEEHGTTLE